MLETADEIGRLARKLAHYESVSKFDSDDELEAWRLAISLSDMEKSFLDILNNHLPALCEASDEKSINEILWDIGEELSHILYHIRDPKYFGYLRDDVNP